MVSINSRYNPIIQKTINNSTNKEVPTVDVQPSTIQAAPSTTSYSVSSADALAMQNMAFISTEKTTSVSTRANAPQVNSTQYPEFATVEEGRAAGEKLIAETYENLLKSNPDMLVSYLHDIDISYDFIVNGEVYQVKIFHHTSQGQPIYNNETDFFYSMRNVGFTDVGNGNLRLNGKSVLYDSEDLNNLDYYIKPRLDQIVNQYLNEGVVNQGVNGFVSEEDAQAILWELDKRNAFDEYPAGITFVSNDVRAKKTDDGKILYPEFSMNIKMNETLENGVTVKISDGVPNLTGYYYDEDGNKYQYNESTRKYEVVEKSSNDVVDDESESVTDENYDKIIDKKVVLDKRVELLHGPQDILEPIIKIDLDERAKVLRQKLGVDLQI